MAGRQQTLELLRTHGIQPSAQRVAIAEYILWTDEHPSADQVWSKVRPSLPVLSRATVYNTLNLLVKKGLLQELVLAEGNIVFDPKLDAHHHFIDEDSGAILDVPWNAVTVRWRGGVAGALGNPRGLEVRKYQVVMHGRRTSGHRRSG